MADNFIDVEKQWLDLLMSIDFLGKEVIERQLEEAYVSERKVYYTYATIHVETNCREPFPYRLKVPVSMDIIPTVGTPITFGLYLNEDGFITDIGIDSLSGDDIDYYNVNLENVKYDVNLRLRDGTAKLRDNL